MEEALRSLTGPTPDVLLLDINLPGLSGIETCRAVRARSEVSIVMLTVRGRAEDKIQALDAGADGYVTKPFDVNELLARIRARLRDRDPHDNVIGSKDLTMDRDRHEVRRGGKEIQLTAKEYALLEYLLLHRNKVHTRDELFNVVWGSDFLGDSNLIDVYVRYLRGKIDDGFDEKLITTVRGVGYTIKD